MIVCLPHNGWTPRPYQLGLWKYLEQGGKRAVAVWHRRSGKEDVCLHWSAVAAHERIGTYWHLLPESSQARKVVWEAVNPHTGMRRIDEVFPEALRAVTRENEMFIRFKNNSTWQVLGSDNYESLIGSPPIGVVFSEYALANPQCWAYLRPIFAESNGWAVFIYTPRGHNHGETLYRSAAPSGWFSELLTANDTTVFTPEQLEIERTELESQYGVDIGRSYYEQEYHCSFSAAVVGSVYGAWLESAEREGRITNVPYDKRRDVYVSFDLGYGDVTAMWFFQVYPNEIHYIDYYEASGHGVDHYIDILLSRGYKYHKHLYLPHDAAHSLMAAGGRSIRQQFWGAGYRSILVNAASDDIKIQAGRATLKVAWLDAVKTKEGRGALMSYHYSWNPDTKKMSDNPIHDWSSHAAHSFGYSAIMWRKQALPKQTPDPKYPINMTINEMVKKRRNARLSYN